MPDAVRNKGQASLVDVLLLALFITTVVVLGSQFGHQALTTQIAREEGFYSRSMLLSAMAWTNTTFGSYENTENMSVAQALDAYFCYGEMDRKDIESAVNYTLAKTNKVGYDYIFYASKGASVVWLWNKQADVCASAITLSSLDLKLSCGNASYFKPTLGIWPDWKQIPPKSACEGVVEG